MQEEVKEKEVLYKDILKEREEMLERISGYDKEMYRLESQRENRKGKKKELLDYNVGELRDHISSGKTEDRSG